jgi:hypothetical protein
MIVVRDVLQVPAPSSIMTCKTWIYISHETLHVHVCRTSVVEFRVKKRFVYGNLTKDNSKSKLWVVKLCSSVRSRFWLDRSTSTLKHEFIKFELEMHVAIISSESSNLAPSKSQTSHKIWRGNRRLSTPK